MAKTKAEQIAETPIENIIKEYQGNRKGLESMLKTLQTGYNRRIESLKRKDLVSHAQIAFEASKPKNIPTSISKMSYNQLILEIARYSSFFTSETATESGIRRVNREQDIRLFGEGKRGKPNRSLTNEEREKYWSVYEEFKNQYELFSTQPYSETVQQSLAEIMFQDGQQELSMMTLLHNVEESVEEKIAQENLRSVPNVLSGDWYSI